MSALSSQNPMWVDSDSASPVGQLYAMACEWRTVFTRGPRPTVIAPSGVEWAAKPVQPIPVRPRGARFAYPLAREGAAYEIVYESGDSDGWLIEMRSEVQGNHQIKINGADLYLQVSDLQAPSTPTLSTAFGTAVDADAWDTYFAAFGARTQIERINVIKRWHATLHDLGLTPYQPHWWLWLLGEGQTNDSGAYYDGSAFSYGSADAYLREYDREFLVQSIGMYLRLTRPGVFAPKGIPQDQADLPAFYAAIKAWQARNGLRAWVHIDEPGIRFDTSTSLARVKRIADAGAAAGVTVGATAWGPSALPRWAAAGIRLGRYVLAHNGWDWQRTPPASVVPAGADFWFYGAGKHPAFYVASGGLPSVKMVADAWRYGAKGILFWAVNGMQTGNEAQDPGMSSTGNNVDIWLYPRYGLSLRAYHWREALSFHALLVLAEQRQGRSAVDAALKLLPDVEAVRRALLVSPLQAALRDAAQGIAFVRINPTAALFSAIVADGFMPTSNENTLQFEGDSYVIQRAESAYTGKSRLYYAVAGQWRNVRWLEIGS